MIPFVDKTDLDEYKYVADSIKNTTTWEQFVSDAQLFDVKSWLGDGLLHELELQASTSPESFSVANLKLLNGGTYIYNSRTYMFQGLKACIIYYAFARFTNRVPYNYTAAGIVIKDSDLSTPATDKHIQRLETEAKLQADAIRCEIIMFLNRNYKDYPLWSNKCGSSSCRSSRPFIVMGD